MIRVNPEIVKSNFEIAQKYLESRGVKASVMQKHFYGSLCIDEALDGSYYQLWGQHYGSFNYLIGKSLELNADYAGGIVSSIEEAVQLRDKYTTAEKPFKGYIPFNWNDDREGLDFEEGVALLQVCNSIQNEYFNCSNVMITAGCLHDNVPSNSKFFELCEQLRFFGCENVSVGGSFWLQVSNFHPIVEECRLGEFIIYGTIPFLSREDTIKGSPAIKVELPILQVHKTRKQVVVAGGSTYFDAKNSEVLTKGFTFIQQSTEYTILSYEDTLTVNSGDKIEFLPDYHSLIKILK